MRVGINSSNELRCWQAIVHSEAILDLIHDLVSDLEVDMVLVAEAVQTCKLSNSNPLGNVVHGSSDTWDFLCVEIFYEELQDCLVVVREVEGSHAIVGIVGMDFGT